MPTRKLSVKRNVGASSATPNSLNCSKSEGEDAGRDPVSRSLDLIEIIAQASKPTPLHRLAAHLGVHRTTASRLLATLSARGYVERDPATLSYRPGPMLAALSPHASRNLRIEEAAQPVMDALAQETRETVTLSILTGDQAIDIAISPGLEPITYAPAPGMINPLHCTATGRVLAAFHDPDELNKLLPRALFAYTAKTVQDVEKVKAIIQTVRQNGVAISDEEFIDNLYAIGVPVVGQGGKLAAALVISAPRFRVTEERSAAYITALKRASGIISLRIGAVPREG